MRFNKFKKFIKIFIKKLGFLKSGCIFVSQLIYNTTKKLQIMNSVNVIKNRITNKVMFFLNGVQVYPVSISGNIYKFENGQNIIL